MGSIFNKISLKRPQRSTFDLSYDHKLSLKMGKLVPVHVQECVPGDKFRISSEAMFRMMPMISPIMHKVDIYIHHFFVPNRILWKNWEEFITGGQEGRVPPAFPVLDSSEVGNVTASSLADYLGLPLGNYAPYQNDTPINALPFAAYNRIWFEYYRDQNLQHPDLYNYGSLGDGQQTADTTAILLELKDRAWEHDYFTSCLPFAQKGDAVELPIDLAGDLDVKLRPDKRQSLRYPSTGNPAPGQKIESDGGDATLQAQIDGPDVVIDPEDSLYVEGDELSTTTTINDLRTAFSLQKWLEKNARAGSRYVESLMAHFGVRSSDKRMQRPEYLGGSKASMAISEVLQTGQTEATPQGNMAGHGISVTGGKDFTHFCEEHGYIIGILSIRPKTAYYQGLPRHFSKTDRMQYYWPDFAFLGEQEVLNKEIKITLDGAFPSQNNGTFGYLPRYSEYRSNPSRVSGEMQTTLDFWHMGRKFDNVPTLNAEFIQCRPTKRIFAVEDPESDEIVAHIWHRILATRPLPKYGNPGGI